MDQTNAIAIVKNYVAYLKENKYQVQHAYLFGSYASGKQHEDSDIDLAIVMENLANSFLTRIELMKISRKFDTRIEPHPIELADLEPSTPFAHEILSKGIQIA